MGKTQYTLDSTVRLIIRILVVILIFFSIRYLYGVLGNSKDFLLIYIQIFFSIIFIKFS